MQVQQQRKRLSSHKLSGETLPIPTENNGIGHKRERCILPELSVELHTQFPFLHWLPQRVYDKILNRLSKSWVDSRNINLLTKRQVIESCKAAGAKKKMIKGNRLCGFVMDYIIIME